MTNARKAGLVALVTTGLLLAGAGAASAQPTSLLNTVSKLGASTGAVDPSVVSQVPVLQGVGG